MTRHKQKSHFINRYFELSMNSANLKTNTILINCSWKAVILNGSMVLVFKF